MIAGRIAARGGMQLSLLALFPIWGPDEFGRLVTATGTFLWLYHAIAGAEKAALTALPRTTVLTGWYTRMLLARAAAPAAVAVPVALLLSPVGGSAALYAAAAGNIAVQGLLGFLAALQRLGGHPGRDTAAYGAYAGWVVAVSALTVAGVLGPRGYLLALTAGLLVICGCLARLVPALRPGPVRARAGGRTGRMISRRMVLLGLSDVGDSAALSSVYIGLALFARPADAAIVYVAVLASTVCGSVCVLVLRLAQPATSLRLRGTAGELGRRRARRITGRTAAVTCGLVGVAAVATAIGSLVGGGDAMLAIGANRAVLGAVTAVEIVAFCGLAYAVYLLENTNGAVLRITATAAVAGLAATAAAVAVAVPLLHAVGAMAALVVGLAAKAAWLTTRLSVTRPVAPPRTAQQVPRLPRP